jgi:phage/plasmid-like protein (TIGR03299 family)
MTAAVETMAYAGEVPWHKLGKKVPADLSPEQMAIAAGVDWTVSKVPAFANIAGEQKNVGWSALVRDTDSKILDIVSNDWIPNQNSEAFKFFNEFCDIGDMSMETAGALDDGRIVWALARVKDTFEVFGGDRVDSYLLFTNPHKFGWSIDVRFTPVRVVCMNTLTMALNHSSQKGLRTGDRANSVKQTHRSEFNADKVKSMLGLAHSKMGKYKEAAEFLGTKEYTDELLKKYMNSVFPKINAKIGDEHTLSKNAEKALAFVESQPGAEFAKNTWWQAFNAATYFVDHVQGRTAETRLKSAWFGQGKGVKLNALNTAIDFAKGKLPETV